VDDPSDLITRVDRLRGPGRLQVEGLSARTQSMSVDQVTWIIHEGSFLFIIYHNCQKVVPFGESCPGTHTGYRIFLSHGNFASRSAGFLGRIFIIILLKLKRILQRRAFHNIGHFINAMTIMLARICFSGIWVEILILLDNNWLFVLRFTEPGYMIKHYSSWRARPSKNGKWYFCG
jgi:hypothetical protein